MKKWTKIISFAGILLLLIMTAMISFKLGIISANREVCIYHVGGHTEVYPRDWPTYNLPIIEFSVIASALKNNNPELAQRRVNLFLNTVRDKAKQRLRVASESEKKKIQEVLYKDFGLENNDNLLKETPVK